MDHFGMMQAKHSWRTLPATALPQVVAAMPVAWTFPPAKHRLADNRISIRFDAQTARFRDDGRAAVVPERMPS